MTKKSKEPSDGKHSPATPEIIPSITIDPLDLPTKGIMTPEDFPGALYFMMELFELYKKHGLAIKSTSTGKINIAPLDMAMIKRMRKLALGG